MKIIIKALLAAAIVIAASYYAFSFHTAEKVFTPVEAGPDPVIEKDLKRIRLESALIDGFERKKELITQEVLLSEVMEWDESWGKLGLFRKSQRVRFYGTGIYICDLNEISRDDIKVDFNNRIVRVLIPPPKIKGVTIDETKTEYEKVERGILRFGDVKLTQRQYTFIYSAVKHAMKKSMESPEMRQEAVESAKEAVADIFSEILGSIGEEYIVHISAKGL